MSTIVVWPQVAVTVKGNRRVLKQGSKVPSGVPDRDLEVLIATGALAPVAETATSTAAKPPAAKPPAAKPPAAKPPADPAGADGDE